MKYRIFLTILFFGFAALAIPGCSYDEDLTASLPALYPATGLKAASFDSTSVILTWNPSPSETDSRFQGYKLFWTYTNIYDTSLAKPDSVILPVGTASYRVTGLANGVEYTFILYALPVAEVVAVIPSIQWAPSSAYSAIALTEHSVLALYDTTRTPAGPTVYSSTDPNAQALGDLVLDTAFTLRSTSSLGAGWRQTVFSTVTTPTTSEPVQMPSFPAVGTFTDSAVVVQPQTAYYCRTQDGHYARIYVTNDQVDVISPRIVVDISYQTRVNLPFAKRSQN